jgi:hypothetical protein
MLKKMGEIVHPASKEAFALDDAINEGIFCLIPSSWYVCSTEDRQSQNHDMAFSEGYDSGF